MSPPVDRIAAMFDAASSTYDAVGVDFFVPIAAGLLAAVDPRPGERILDIGCGRGAVLWGAASAVGPQGWALGTDISPGMVDQARAVAEESGLTQVEVRVDDASAPRIAERDFDLITSSLVLFFLPDPAGALEAWRPLLRPGGRLGITTFGPVDPRWESVDAVFAPYLPPTMRDARTSGKAGPFASDAGMEALIGGAGFDDLRTVTGAVSVRFADAGQWEAFTWSTGQRAMWQAIPEDDRPAARAEAIERLSAYADSDGSVTFTQQVRHTLARRP